MGTRIENQECSIKDCSEQAVYRIGLRAKTSPSFTPTEYALCAKHGDELLKGK